MKDDMRSYKMTARVVGVLYVAGMVVGIAGFAMIQKILGEPNRLSLITASSMQIAVGAVLWLLTVAGDAAHGVLMYPVLKQHNKRVAVGYLSFRIIDAIFIAIQVLFILLQIPLASEFLKAAAYDNFALQALSNIFIQGHLYAYNIGMLFLGIASLMLCYTLYQAKLVPRFLAVWGIIGYATILCGSALEILGMDLKAIHTIPGGLWELFTGVWLIFKGFVSYASSPSLPTKD